MSKVVDGRRRVCYFALSIEYFFWVLRIFVWVAAGQASMLFFSYFKELVGKEVTVELKNDLAIRGTLHSVDQYLNIKLENTRVVEQDKYPHMLSVKNCFIRGSVVRYVLLPPDGVDVDILHDATRREARGG